jgi:hypothetical protein
MMSLPSFTRLCRRPHFLRVGHSVSLGLGFVGLRQEFVGVRHFFWPSAFLRSLTMVEPLSYALHTVVRTYV